MVCLCAGRGEVGLPPNPPVRARGYRICGRQVSRRARKASSQPAGLSLPSIEPFDPSSLHAFSAHGRISAGGVVHRGPALILVHVDIQHPMEAVFDPPSGRAPPRRSGSVKAVCRAGDRRSRAGYAIDLAAAHDLADSSETRPLMLLLKPGDVGADGRPVASQCGRDRYPPPACWSPTPRH
jgi:hypothetical protein